MNVVIESTWMVLIDMLLQLCHLEQGRDNARKSRCINQAFGSKNRSDDSNSSFTSKNIDESLQDHTSNQLRDHKQTLHDRASYNVGRYLREGIYSRGQRPNTAQSLYLSGMNHPCLYACCVLVRVL